MNRRHARRTNPRGASLARRPLRRLASSLLTGRTPYMFSQRTRGLVLAAAMLPQLACHEYHAITMTNAPIGEPIRLTLTDRGSVELAALIGPQVTALDGAVTTPGDSVLHVRVSSVINRVGYTTTWNGEEVRVPATYVVSIERRTLNRKKSWVVAGLSVAAVAAIGTAFTLIGGRSGGSSSTGTGGGPR